jgi:hypothetical protein
MGFGPRHFCPHLGDLALQVGLKARERGLALFAEKLQLIGQSFDDPVGDNDGGGPPLLTSNILGEHPRVVQIFATMDRNDSFRHDVISTIAYDTAKPTEGG